MKTTLEVGKDYAFATPAPKGSTMVYLGGNSWCLTAPDGRTMTAESAKQTAGILEYINRPSYRCGT